MSLPPSAMIGGEHVIFREPVEELKLHVWEAEHHGQYNVVVMETSEERAKIAADAFVANVPVNERSNYDDWGYPQHYTKKVYEPGQVVTFAND